MSAPTTSTATSRAPAALPERAGTGSAWRLVARREVMVRATDRSFLLGTGVTLAIIAALIGLQAYLGSRTQDFAVVATPEAASMAQSVAAAATERDEKVAVTVETVTDAAAARAAVTDESADAWLSLSDDGSYLLTTRSEPQSELESVTQEVVLDVTLRLNAAAQGTSVEALTQGSVLQTALLEGDAQRAELVSVVGFAFAFLFYVSALLFGFTLAGSVVEEKQSRVAEIIAASIPVRHLLAGKVLGNTLLALVQLTLYIAVGLAGLAFTDYSGLVTAISGPVVWFLIFFLAGFVALACLWAVAGSLASRAEDLQSSTTPLTILVLGVTFGGLFLEGSWQVIASYVPPLSAVVMPIRLLEGDAAWWEAVLSLGLLLAAAAVIVAFAERIYRRSLLQTGGQVSLRRAWAAKD